MGFISLNHDDFCIFFHNTIDHFYVKTISRGLHFWIKNYADRCTGKEVCGGEEHVHRSSAVWCTYLDHSLSFSNDPCLVSLFWWPPSLVPVCLCMRRKKRDADVVVVCRQAQK